MVLERQYVTVHFIKIYIDKNGYLDLRRRGIKDMNEVIGLDKLQGLRRLSLGNYDENDSKIYENKWHYNDISEFRAFKSFELLEELDLSYCFRFTSFLGNLKYLKNLQKLSLKHCKSLELLPKSIKQLRSLKKLDLSYCYKLKTLPRDISSLKLIKEINLNFCVLLESVPDSVYDIKSLETLNLFNCYKLSSLPEIKRNVLML